MKAELKTERNKGRHCIEENMADPFPTPARYGLILGDSILRTYYDHDEPLLNSMKKKFGLDVIVNGCKKGGISP